MCENFSGAHEHRKLFPNPKDDGQRYKELNKVDLWSNLAYLNLGDIKKLTNRSMRTIAINLMSSILDLCVWGCYTLTNDGILELCMSHPEAKLRRINHCGCYKISDDSRLWFASSFKEMVINYIPVEEFGKDVDYSKVVETPSSVLHPYVDKDKAEPKLL